MKMSEKLQEIKKDNKGFSLVELIIVIAIMAILIGIVGMNVIPQIENARRATDAQVLSAFVSEAMEAWTQADAASTVVTISITNASGTLTMPTAVANPATATDKVINKFLELEGSTTRVLKSNAGKTKIGNIKVICDPAKGVYIGTVDDSGNYTPAEGFEDYEFRSR